MSEDALKVMINRIVNVSNEKAGITVEVSEDFVTVWGRSTSRIAVSHATWDAIVKAVQTARQKRAEEEQREKQR